MYIMDSSIETSFGIDESGNGNDVFLRREINYPRLKLALNFDVTQSLESSILWTMKKHENV